MDIKGHRERKGRKEEEEIEEMMKPGFSGLSLFCSTFNNNKLKRGTKGGEETWGVKDGAILNESASFSGSY